MQLFILVIHTNYGLELVGGVYSALEKAKEAAHFQLQCDALEETLTWEPVYQDLDHSDEISFYRIKNGCFKDCADIHVKQLDALF